MSGRTTPSFGWIVQPAVFDDPPGVPPWDEGTARDLLAANDRHVALVRDIGWNTVWVEDHMGWGDKAHLECFTTMAWLAGRHPGLRWGTMVCGQGFRNPAYLAKLAVNMRLLSGGRFVLGIGAGNNGLEHAQFGFPFPPAPERLDRTEEAIRIVRALWREPHATVDGKHYRIDGATVAPLPDAPIPLMVGGNGEKRTLRLAAQHADWWCADVGTVETFARKNAVLDAHCAAVGRDPRDIVRAQVVWVSVEEDSARAVRWPDLHIVAGTPEEVVAELRRFAAAGVEHCMVRFLDFPRTDNLERFVARVLPRLDG